MISTKEELNATNAYIRKTKLKIEFRLVKSAPTNDFTIVILLFQPQKVNPKRFKVYLTGAITTVRSFANQNLNIRLYTDSSIINNKDPETVAFYNELLQTKKIEIVEIDAKSFKIGDHHINVIHFIFRYFPIHDWGIKDRRTFAFIDLDYPAKEIKNKRYKFIDIYRRSKGYFYYGKLYDYYKIINPRLTVASAVDKGIIIRQNGNTFCTNYKFSADVLLKFMIDMVDGEKEYREWYEGVADIMEKHKDLLYMSPKNNFVKPYDPKNAIGVYGFDEYYISAYLLPFATYNIPETYAQSYLDYVHGIEYVMYCLYVMHPVEETKNLLYELYDTIEGKTVSRENIDLIHQSYETSLYHNVPSPISDLVTQGVKKYIANDDIVARLSKLNFMYMKADLGKILAKDFVRLRGDPLLDDRSRKFFHLHRDKFKMVTL